MSKDPSSITGGSFSKCLVEACVDNGNRVEGEDLGLSAGDQGPMAQGDLRLSWDDGCIALEGTGAG